MPEICKKMEVAVRVRPMSSQENIQPGNVNVLTVLEDCLVMDPQIAAQPCNRMNHGRYYGHENHNRLRGAKKYNFDRIHGPRCSQEATYEQSVKHIVMESFTGINGAVLAYGATGSGKTHTMFGNVSSAPGVVFQAAADIFAKKEEFHRNGKFVSIYVSYYEVYNENVYDLLHQPPVSNSDTKPEAESLSRTKAAQRRQQLPVRDAIDGNSADIPNLSRHTPTNIQAFRLLIEQGMRNRITASTSANAQSSRSHAILAVDVEVRESERAETGTVGRLKLCDLAGSERAAGTQNRGETLKEGANINRSLLALGTVVQVLACNKPNKFVPYRGSKLTRLLKDCLGGNCNTSMLVCISPSSRTMEESCNTLQYACYAKKIEVAAKSNEFATESDIVKKQLRALVEKTKAQVEALKEENRILQEKLSHAEPKIRHSGYVPSSQLLDDEETESVGVDTNDLFLHTGSVGGNNEPNPILLAFQQMQKQYNALRDRKDDLFEKLKSVDEAKENEFEAKIRAERCKMAAMYASDEHNGNSSQQASGVKIPPVALAGLQQSIAYIQQCLNEVKEGRSVVQGHLLQVDQDIKQLNDQVVPDELKPFKAVLQENLQTWADQKESQQMAAYYLSLRHSTTDQRESEIKQAIERSTSVLRKLVENNGITDNATKKRALEAIAYSVIPDSSTKDMFNAFKSKMEDVHAIQTLRLNSARVEVAPSTLTPSSSTSSLRSIPSLRSLKTTTVTAVPPAAQGHATNNTTGNPTGCSNNGKKHNDPYAFVASLSVNPALAVQPIVSSKKQVNTSSNNISVTSVKNPAGSRSNNVSVPTNIMSEKFHRSATVGPHTNSFQRKAKSLASNKENRL